MPTPRLTRRQLLAAAGAGLLGTAAGCAGVLGSDDETEMTLMIERIRDSSDAGETGGGAVSAGALVHTCSHLEELEPFSLDAAESQSEAATANAHEPYTVTLPGDAGYVAFEPSDDAQYGFFAADGTVSVATGTVVHEEDGVEDCDTIDRYAVVEPEDGEIVVELSAGN
jgi:hypothetical protein